MEMSSVIKSESIVLFVSDLRPGGAQKQIVELASFLSNKFNVTLLTWYSSDEDFFKLPENIGRIAIDNNSFKTKNMFKSFSKIMKTRRIIREINPIASISFLHEINAWNILSTIGIRNIKVIISIREHPGQNPLTFKSLLYKFLNKKSQILVCQTEEIKKWLLSKKYHDNIAVIPNFIKIVSLEKRDFTQNNLLNPILAIGTKSYQKGFDLLVRSYKIAFDAGLRNRLNIVGLQNIKEREDLLRLVEELRISDKVDIYGYQKNLKNWFKESSLFVLSSRFEGMPNVLVEAIANRIPIVSFDCPSGPREILNYGQLGILVPPQDILSLGTSIHKILVDESLYSTFKSKLIGYQVDNYEQVGKLWEDAIRN